MTDSVGFPQAQALHALAYLRELQKGLAEAKQPAPPELLGSLVVACVLDLHLTQLREQVNEALKRGLSRG